MHGPRHRHAHHVRSTGKGGPSGRPCTADEIRKLLADDAAKCRVQTGLPSLANKRLKLTDNSELRPRDGTWTAAKVDIRKGDAGVQWIICAVCNNAGPGKQCSKCQKALGEGGPMSSGCLSPGLVWSPATPTRSCADCSPAQGAMVRHQLILSNELYIGGGGGGLFPAHSAK